MGLGLANAVKPVRNGLPRTSCAGKAFIRNFEEASKCYIDALQHHQPDVLVLVALYAKTSEMRVVSSPEVFAAAEDIVRRLVDTYSKADIKFTDTELKTVVQDGSFDLLRDFSESCRDEFEHLRANQL